MARLVIYVDFADDISDSCAADEVALAVIDPDLDFDGARGQYKGAWWGD